jgi:hypothetical protein
MPNSSEWTQSSKENLTAASGPAYKKYIGMTQTKNTV